MRRTTFLAVAVTAVLTLAGCDDDHKQEPAPAQGPTTTPTPVVAPPPPPAPRIGECYRLSYDEALAPTNTDSPVPCDKGHTSQTFAVGQLNLISNGHLLAVDSDAVQKQVAKRCPAQLGSYVGGTEAQRRLSLLRPVWFTPTVEQSDAGASWYRCDVIAVTGDNAVAKVDHKFAGALKEPAGRAEFAMCATAQPGTPQFSRVLCGEDHTWKAISVVDLADKARKKGVYPGEDTVRNAGQDACQEAARAIASDALDYEWGYEWPTKDQWKAGQTYGRCWSPDPA
ncbi:MAG TPA: septum formation family protein [Nocardioides sp.]|uniref:septum formation family protein n=1 Tax=Nocardioides sp. TaxID=35761 RepID=UPI002E31639C|nr:septum formation family protein [Nocardioides sp.]HEX5090042.1 septum formation family protein [Nocardioides sp.]